MKWVCFIWLVFRHPLTWWVGMRGGRYFYKNLIHSLAINVLDSMSATSKNLSSSVENTLGVMEYLRIIPTGQGGLDVYVIQAWEHEDDVGCTMSPALNLDLYNTADLGSFLFQQIPNNLQLIWRIHPSIYLYFFDKILVALSAWTHNSIHMEYWHVYVMTHTCPTFICDLSKPQNALGQWWVSTSHRKLWV